MSEKKTYESVVEQLNAKIPREVISERDGGGGRKLAYLEGWYIINRLNEVFGPGNWAYMSQAQVVHEGKVTDRYGKEKFTAHYTAFVRLTVTFPGGLQTEFTDYGYGDGTDTNSAGKCHELAVKEAVTDGIKRCAKNLGMSMGLALYDKTQENVSDAGTETAVIPQSVGSTPIGTPSTEISNGSASAPSKATVLKSISTTSRVIIAKQLRSEEELRQYMKEKYGVENKESLPLPKAKELLTYLEGVMNA